MPKRTQKSDSTADKCKKTSITRASKQALGDTDLLEYPLEESTLFNGLIFNV